MKSKVLSLIWEDQTKYVGILSQAKTQANVTKPHRWVTANPLNVTHTNPATKIDQVEMVQEERPWVKTDTEQ